MPTFIVTGAAGFIGSALCRYLRGQNLGRVVGIDKMTYAASRQSVAALQNDPQFELVEADICNAIHMSEVVARTQPDGIFHLAAETHVDRSIDMPDPFLQTNIIGTYALLEVARFHVASLPPERREQFRFLHVSTDEVYGALGETGSFSETTAYAPNSPYAASKAAADHIARAWHKTYGLPVIISNCSNNYGPFQFPEKLIPLMITKAVQGEKLPVYGQGLNVRDWLFVEDHVEALYLILTRGRIGEKYHVGGAAERRNIDLVKKLCDIFDEIMPKSPHWPHHNLIDFVADRPGHDERYAMNFGKLKNELGWQPRTSFGEGLRKTVEWYLDNHRWSQDIHSSIYGGERLGQIARSA